MLIEMQTLSKNTLPVMNVFAGGII